MEVEQQQQEHLPTVDRFPVFLLFRTAQNSFGIKTADYQRYRRYCSRKALKLRKTIGVKFGNQTKFIKKDMVKDKFNDNRILQIALFNAEKNWAYANETKFSSHRKESQKARARFHSIKKLGRAYFWAKKLNLVCQERADSITKLEAQAYEMFLEGLLHLERQKWNEAQLKLIGCREILHDLMKICDTMTERIYRQKIDQIQQTIKFCNFKISKGKEIPIAQIIEMKKIGDPNLSNLIESLTARKFNEISINETSIQEIRFQDERYPMKQQAIIHQKTSLDSQLLNLQEIKKKSFENMEDEQLYEQLLSFYSRVVLLADEAIKLTDSEKEDRKKKQKYTQGEIEILKKVSLLFQEIKMKLFIDRNETIFRFSYDANKGKKSTPQMHAKMFTATINLYYQLADIVKEKGQISQNFAPEHLQELDAKVFYLRAIRLLFVGQVYFNNDKIIEANALWNECQRCLKILQSKDETQNMANQKRFIELSKVHEQIRTNKLKCTIQNYYQQANTKTELNEKVKGLSLEEKESQKSKEQSISSLEELIFKENIATEDLSLQRLSEMPIIELPGVLRPLPARPIFFDIYEFSINYPAIDKKVKKEKSGGWWKTLFKS